MHELDVLLIGVSKITQTLIFLMVGTQQSLVIIMSLSI